MSVDNDFCLFGNRMSYAEPTEFDIRYIHAQRGISYEELGDQLDQSLGLVESVAIQVGANTGDQKRRAEEIQYCMQQRYLGICSMKGCLYRETVEHIFDA